MIDIRVKILRDYLDNFQQNLIPDEIREYVKIYIRNNCEICLTGCDGGITSFIIEVGSTKYLYGAPEHSVFITFHTTKDGKKEEEITEEMILQKINFIKENYNNIYNKQIKRPSLNPAIKKLIKVAKEIREEIPVEIRWLTKITQKEKNVILTFPQNLLEVQKETPQGKYMIEFSKDETILNSFCGENIGDLRYKIDAKEGKKRLMEFLNTLIKQLN